MADFLRLPEKSDYTDATTIVNDVIEHVGDAWVYGMQREIAAKENPLLRNKFGYAGIGGLMLEIVDGDNKPVDKLLRTTQAYKHGMMVGYDIAELVHGELIEYTGLTNYLGAQLLARYGDSNPYGKADYLVDMSERGLALSGDSAREKIEKWSEQFTFSVDLRRTYTLGIGATIFSGAHIHQGYVDAMIEAATGDIDWTNPLAMPGNETSSIEQE